MQHGVNSRQYTYYHLPFTSTIHIISVVCKPRSVCCGGWSVSGSMCLCCRVMDSPTLVNKVSCTTIPTLYIKYELGEHRNYDYHHVAVILHLDGTNTTCCYTTLLQPQHMESLQRMWYCERHASGSGFYVHTRLQMLIESLRPNAIYYEYMTTLQHSQMKTVVVTKTCDRRQHLCFALVLC